jgi:hypothetical protein
MDSCSEPACAGTSLEVNAVCCPLQLVFYSNACHHRTATIKLLENAGFPTVANFPGAVAQQ